MDGILNIYKEKGFTSHDVVAKLRGILHKKKVGHAGTLDPDATGVLPVLVGNATKASDMIADKGKTYEAVLYLGRDTDTEDMAGTILKECPVTCGEKEVESAVSSFLGTYGQIPPMYSAIKRNGQKLYELARAGKTVERMPRPVTFYEISIVGMELPRVKLLVSCGKGAYIRSLCRDIGEKLGCGGCMESLVRTRVGSFRIEDAITLSQAEALMKEDKILEVLKPTDHIFGFCPAVYGSREGQKRMRNGNPLPESEITVCGGTIKDGQWLRLYDDDRQFIGIYAYDLVKKRIRPVKMFLPQNDTERTRR